MASVTQRIKLISQPRGGYINPKSFTEIPLTSIGVLNHHENIHASLVGLSVDYLTRFMLGTIKEEAFKISLLGARNVYDTKNALLLLKNIDGLNEKSIISACKLVGYDVAFRSSPMGYRPVKDINPDKDTIQNIAEMVNRSLNFFKMYGPIVLDGFTFEGAYTETINAGDGDFITETTLWDFKVSIASPTKDHTLQLLVYYLMGLKSVHSSVFSKMKTLGVYNPRLNIVYLQNIDDISKDVIDEVSHSVIGY